MEPTHVGGAKRGHVFLYALSTCAWCKKTKRLMSELGVDYYYIDVDLLEDDEKTRVQNELRQWNPRCSFPTIVIDNNKALTTFDEVEIRQALSDE